MTVPSNSPPPTLSENSLEGKNTRGTPRMSNLVRARDPQSGIPDHRTVRRTLGGFMERTRYAAGPRRDSRSVECREPGL
jgi:hypothetical protein